MTAFTKYMHLERLGTAEVEGIEHGMTYVFPKLDGTNASVWLGEDGEVKAGSRNRQLALGSDNAGFYAFAFANPALKAYLLEHPTHILYGEWLVPHSLKTYRDDCWRRFYIFDVFDTETERFLPYDQYSLLVAKHRLDFLSPLALIKDGDPALYTKIMEQNTVCLKDGAGIGEGIVIKNYNFVNRYGRVVWAKLVTNAFKEEHHKAMGAPILGSDLVEQRIVDKYVTQEMIDKVYAKMILDTDGWHSKMIPQLLNTVFYDLVREETWAYIKEHKLPSINFKALQQFTIVKVKEIRKDLF